MNLYILTVPVREPEVIEASEMSSALCFAGLLQMIRESICGQSSACAKTRISKKVVGENLKTIQPGC